jgi:acyl-CoA synthetase (AMP-forming)/AMP-acid ligase II
VTAVALAEAIRSRALADPYRSAITHDNVSFTRVAVDELSDLAAWRLLSLGAQPGSVIAISGMNSPELLMLFFAVWKVGATPLPLHSRKPVEELVVLIDRSNASIAVGFDDDVVSSIESRTRCVALNELFVPGEFGDLPTAPVSPTMRIGVSGGSAWIDGCSWLERPGSVGKPQAGCQIAIFDAAGDQLPAGQLGTIFIRDLTGQRNFHYVGVSDPSVSGDWETVGDMGYLDDAGYLYIADRAADMISTATGLVAPLPLEGAIEYHPAVRSTIVIGLPDGCGFDRVHAIVDTPGIEVSNTDLALMLTTAFPGLGLPDSWERSAGPLRDNAGKARRQMLRRERLNGDDITDTTESELHDMTEAGAAND